MNAVRSRGDEGGLHELAHLVANENLSQVTLLDGLFFRGTLVTYYLSLGPGRSYQKVAEHYDVTKRAARSEGHAVGSC